MTRPRLENWRLICESNLVGEVSGHPEIPDGWITTSQVCKLNRTEGWARTESRYYSLGNELPASEALPEEGREQLVNRLVRNYKRLGKVLTLELLERIEEFASKQALPLE